MGEALIENWYLEKEDKQVRLFDLLVFDWN